MLLPFFYLLLGASLIVFGAHFLTDGASSIASKLQISDLVIGLTVVAFGTSAPELSVSLISALKGSSNMALGNVFGSNIFNVLVILGFTTVVMPVKVGKTSINREIPFAFFAALILAFFAWFPHSSSSVANISRGEGLILFFLGISFLAYTVRLAKQNRIDKEEIRKNNARLAIPIPEAEVSHLPLTRSIPYVILGLLALVYGGHVFVDNASLLARHFGISETIIGLTLVAGGTSLPELATSIAAAIKKKPEMALGNVIGSNIFNIFFVLGISASIKPLERVTFSMMDLFMQVFCVLLLWLFAKWISPGIIKRWQGFVLVLVFAFYMAYLFTSPV